MAKSTRKEKATVAVTMVVPTQPKKSKQRAPVRRPASGICQFCLKMISRANWSRHLRTMHSNDIAEMQHTCNIHSSPEESPIKQPPADEEGFAEEANDDDVSHQQQRLLSATTKIEVNELEEQGTSQQQNQNGESSLVQPKEQIHSEDDEEERASATGKQESEDQQPEEKPPLRRSMRNAARRVHWNLLRLPKSDICPLCEQRTSQGNWARHLRRHHPEFVPDTSFSSSDGSDQKDEKRNKAQVDNAKAAVDLPPAFRLVPLFAQPIQHTDFDLYGSTSGINQMELDGDDQPKMEAEELADVEEIDVKEEQIVLVAEQEAVEEQQVQAVQQQHSAPETNNKEAGAPQNAGEGASTPTFSPERVGRRPNLVRRPFNGICQFCSKKISSANWSRHIRSMHLDHVRKLRPDTLPLPADEPAEAEMMPMPIVSPPVAEEAAPQIKMESAASLDGQEELNNSNNNFSLVVIEGQLISMATSPIKVEDQRKRGRKGMPLLRKTRSAIRLPKSNICPLCERQTSQGNWSRHLKRHHPEYTFQCEVDAVEDGEQQRQQMLLLDDGAGTSAMEQAPEEFVAPTEEVRSFVIRCMQSVGTSFAHAVQLAELLVDADSVGHHSHGLNRLAAYVEEIALGLRGEGEPKVLKQKGATAWVDGSNLLGAVVGNFCTDLAIKLAREHGIGWVLAHNCNHFGIGQHYAKRIAQVGMVGMSFVSTPPSNFPQQNSNANRVCCCANSTKPGDGFLMDMTTVADAPDSAITGAPNGDLSPLPKPPEFNKPPNGMGGIGTMLELFCGIMAGTAQKQNSNNMADQSSSGNLGQCFVAIDPECFAPGFSGCLQQFLDQTREAHSASGAEDSLLAVPGDLERLNAITNHLAGGLVYQDYQIQAQKDLAARCRVQMFSFKRRPQ